MPREQVTHRGRQGTQRHHSHKGAHVHHHVAKGRHHPHKGVHEHHHTTKKAE